MCELRFSGSPIEREQYQRMQQQREQESGCDLPNGYVSNRRIGRDMSRDMQWSLCSEREQCGG